jgi:hypothetical protein
MKTDDRREKRGDNCGDRPAEEARDAYQYRPAVENDSGQQMKGKQHPDYGHDAEEEAGV